MPRNFWIICLISFAVLSCESGGAIKTKSDLNEIQSFISLMDSDLIMLEKEIVQLAELMNTLYQEADSNIKKAGKGKYKFQNGLANVAPNADPDLSTIYISSVATQQDSILNLIYMTEVLDSAFKAIVQKHKMVSQVYFNSPLQVNRLFPPYDAATMLDPNIDLTTFNFYYEADESHNPNMGPVWVNEIYLDPVGKGWMISLIHPVYYQDKLMMVLGFDITVNDILEFYLDRYNDQIVIIDEAGTVVAGKTKAIEALNLPPLTNHTYVQTITSNYFRMEDFNLFKSKSKEVRKMASQFILLKDREFCLQDGLEKFWVTADNMERLNWYVLDLDL